MASNTCFLPGRHLPGNANIHVLLRQVVSGKWIEMSNPVKLLESMMAGPGTRQDCDFPLKVS